MNASCIPPQGEISEMRRERESEAERNRIDGTARQRMAQREQQEGASEKVAQKGDRFGAGPAKGAQGENPGRFERNKRQNRVHEMRLSDEIHSAASVCRFE